MIRRLLLIPGIFTLLWLATRPFLPLAVIQHTPICGTISTHTTWTAANSPYLVCGTTQATVAAGVTLSIEPGVLVEFEPNGRLNVAGELTAVGLPTQPITFTGQTSTPGSWQGLYIHNFATQPATAFLQHVTLAYGGAGAASGQIVIDNGLVTLAHSTVRAGGSYGLYVTSDHNPTVSDTLFQDHGADVARLAGARGDLRFQNITAVGNNQNVIRVGGYSNMSGQRRWQNAGIPYLFTGSAGNQPGDTLTIEPGTEIRFASNTGLGIGGSITAVGLPTQPITFTGQTTTPGLWTGINVEGNVTTAATAVFEYATVAYGGSGYDGANVRIRLGQVQMRHSTVRDGGNDGIRNVGYGRSRTLVETTQITGNNGFGLNNLEPAWPILANNNWWGQASGPQLPAGSACGPGGSGSSISDGVIFRPVLPSPGAPITAAAADDLRLLSITPRRWFVPATGVDRLYVEITLRDGQGNPIPGRTVRLGSTLGQVTDGGITGYDGKTLAYLRSTTAGEAEINAILETQGACELVRSPTAQVTFTPAGSDQGYLPDEAASYMNEGIQIEPLPVIQGTPTTLRVALTNPNNFPVIVDGSFYYYQTNIGLAFGPLADVPGTHIPANGQAVVQTSWTPPLSGDYCVQFDYTARSALNDAPLMVQAGGTTRLNLKSFPGKGRSAEARQAYDTSRKAVSTLSNANDGLTLVTDPAGFIGGYIPGQLFGYITDFWYDTMDTIDAALATDPPRQDFQIISPPEPVTFTPLQPGNGISAAKAQAANAYVAAALDYYQYARAAAIANDRYGGATQAQDMQWASLQLGAVIYYEQQSADKMLVTADRLDDYVTVLLLENPNDIMMTAEIYAAYQNRLATEGFTADEIAAAHLLGMTDAEIEAVRQQRLAVDPATMAGSTTQRLTLFAGTLRALSHAILYPPDPMFIVIGGGSGRMGERAVGSTAVPADDLAYLTMQETTILLGNPHNQTETVNLRVRSIDLPPDWIVEVWPATATLGAGEAVTVTIRVTPGGRVPQGTITRFAVEGYIGDELIGGVGIDTLVPMYTGFNGRFALYLPMIQR